MIVFFSLAFIIRMSYAIWAYSGPHHCRSMLIGTSFWAFLPQAIFFLIFIWAIFKLLVVWRVMVAADEQDANNERKRLQRIQLCFVLVWIVLWITQRTAESIAIEQKESQPGSEK